MSGSTADNAGRQSGVIAAAAAGIEIVSSDPSAEHGKCWFNSTTSLLKVYNKALTAGTWSTGGTLNTARRQFAGAGTLTAGLCAAGTTGSKSVVTEEYNGSSWVAVNAFPTATQFVDGCGTQTAALTAGGDQ